MKIIGLIACIFLSAIGLVPSAANAMKANADRTREEYVTKNLKYLHDLADNHVLSAALMIAAVRGNIKAMNELIAQGANPNFQTPNGVPILGMVLDKTPVNTLDVVKVLVEYGVDVNARESFMPVSFALLQRKDCDPKVLEFLLDNGLTDQFIK